MFNGTFQVQEVRFPSLGPALLVTLVAACFISLLSFGVRSGFGLFTDPLTRELGLSREVYAVAIAIQNLAWGLAQPVAGYLSERFGARRVMAGGAVLYAAGIACMVGASTPWQLYLSAGVLVGLGMGGASFSMALGALGRVMPESHRSWALGLGTAAGSLGQFLIVPLTQAVIGTGTWHSGAWLMTAAIALIVAIAWLVRGDAGQASAQANVPMRRVLGTAFQDRNYVLLILGFFVCGFQLAFITTHLPAYLADRGISASVASWTIALVGLFNVLGSYLAGVWGGRHSKRKLLSVVYVLRGLFIAAFVLAPMSRTTVLLFGAAMGLLWLSTVPLTSGLVATFFGTRYMATLFGFVFLSHQVGSFLGVYLGGVLFERTGSYDLVWWMCVGLSGFAALINLPIRERASAPFGRLAAA